MEKFGFALSLNRRNKSILVILALLSAVYLGEVYHPFSVASDAVDMVAKLLDPSLLRASLSKSGTCEERGLQTYWIKSGDNLTTLSSMSGHTVSNIRKVNGMRKSDSLIKAGKSICLPYG